MSKYRVSLNAIIWVVLSIFSVTMSILFVMQKWRNFEGDYIYPLLAAFTMPIFLFLKKKWLNATIFTVLGIVALIFIKYRDSLHPLHGHVLIECYSFIAFNLIIIMIYFVKYLKSNVKLIVKGQNDT